MDFPRFFVRFFFYFFLINEELFVSALLIKIISAIVGKKRNDFVTAFCKSFGYSLKFGR